MGTVAGHTKEDEFMPALRIKAESIEHLTIDGETQEKSCVFRHGSLKGRQETLSGYVSFLMEVIKIDFKKKTRSSLRKEGFILVHH